MAKEFKYRGKSISELQNMSIQDLAKLLPARQRRTLTRGLTENQKKLINKINKYKEKGIKKPLKTHCRSMIVLPSMVGLTFGIYNGKSFETVTIIEEMIGHRLGEFSQTRKKVVHSSPGIGATKSSAAASVK